MDGDDDDDDDDLLICSLSFRFATGELVNLGWV